jgi:hypothetical protein
MLPFRMNPQPSAWHLEPSTRVIIDHTFTLTDEYHEVLEEEKGVRLSWGDVCTRIRDAVAEGGKIQSRDNFVTLHVKGGAMTRWADYRDLEDALHRASGVLKEVGAVRVTVTTLFNMDEYVVKMAE